METRTYEEVVLKPIRRMVATHLSPEVMESFKLEIRDMPEMFGKQVTMLVDLPVEVMKEYRGISECKIPDTWFDHFRNQYFPNFLARRFPIKTCTIEIPYRVEIDAVYPKLPMSFKNHGGIKFASIPSPSYRSEIRTDLDD